MVNRIVYSLFVITMTCFASAQSTTFSTPKSYTESNDKYEGSHLIRPYRMTAIATVVIKNNAAWEPARSTSDEAAEACTEFVLTEVAVKDFFHRAKRIDSITYDGGLSISRCYATGDISFANGDHGEWEIDRMRRGRIVLQDGHRLYFHGEKARAKIFYEYVNEHSNPPEKPKPKVKIGAIKSITFRKDAPRWGLSEDQKAGLCHFELNEGDVRDYFLRAKIVNLPTFVSKLPHSNCSVEGELEFTDGLKGKWVIESKRRGILELGNGSSAYLYSKGTQAKAFDTP